MSMHELEDYIEFAVRSVATSDMCIQKKRNMIYSLFEMEKYGDCGFTNLRTIQEMIQCQYSFVFDKMQMYDYEQKKAYYDAVDDEDAEEQEEGAPYLYGYFDEQGDWNYVPGKFCVDSGTKTWEEMVRSGAIIGEGAQPVERLKDIDVLRGVRKLFGEMDEDLVEGHAMLFVFSRSLEELRDEEYPEQFGMTRKEFDEE